MKKTSHRFNQKLLLLLVPAIGALAFRYYPRDLDLSRATSNTIKNEAGKPAQLLWCIAGESPEHVINVPKNSGADHDEGYELSGADRWVGRRLKVAEIGDREDGHVKVYLLRENLLWENPESMDKDSEHFYLVQRKDLSQSISLDRYLNDWLYYHTSTD